MARVMNVIQSFSSKDGEHSSSSSSSSSNFVPEKNYETLRKVALKIASNGYKMVLL